MRRLASYVAAELTEQLFPMTDFSETHRLLYVH
jgi:hypothetical protein